MIKSIYIAPFHQNSQEIIVSIGLMEFLKSRYSKITLFKPIATTKEIEDNNFNTIYLFTKDEVQSYISSNNIHKLLEDIVLKFDTIKKEYDFILIEGFDKYKLQLPFELNLQIAKNLNSSFVAVLNGFEKSEKYINGEINIAISSIKNSACNYLGTFVTNSKIKQKYDDRFITFISKIDTLSYPTMYDIYTQLNLTKVYGSKKNFNRQVVSIKIAAMRVENVLENIEDDDLIVVPSDRVDIILGCIVALSSKQLPHISGIVLTSDLPVNKMVLSLLESLDLNLPTNQNPLQI